ncbi:MAG: sulfite exporter TauE/SafE family protein [Clostridia bacterium]|nr:sulfite exporter TauE/SafE family protein [Clostridia bacterium]MBR6650864.1 sulfite exporter TauE/SafE family protein [Clostridia bacterium]
MIIDIIAGLFFGILAGMGIGGGGLLVIYLTFFDAIEQRTAQGVNLFFFLFASAASMLYHINKRRINLPFVVLCTVSGCIFALLGSLAASAVNPHMLKIFFGAMLIIAGAITLWKNIFVKK